jgi:hypothetical protein
VINFGNDRSSSASSFTVTMPSPGPTDSIIRIA